MRKIDDAETYRMRKQLRIGERIEDVDIEVLLVYLSVPTDEMLFANKGAKKRLGLYGKVRDILQLKDLAEERGVFDRRDSRNFLIEIRDVARYRPPEIFDEIKKYD